jgi:hypothetical protein
MDANQYLKENYGYDVEFFYLSIFVIHSNWPFRTWTKKISEKKFLKKQIERLENLKKKTIKDITNFERQELTWIENVLLNYPTRLKDKVEIREDYIIERYKLKPFFDAIDRKILSLKKALDFINRNIKPQNPDQAKLQEIYQLIYKRGAPVRSIYKISSVWALIIKNKNTRQPNWEDIANLLEWFSKNKFKNTYINLSTKRGTPDASSFEREFYRIKRVYGKNFLENLKNKCIDSLKGKLGDGIEILRD